MGCGSNWQAKAITSVSSMAIGPNSATPPGVKSSKWRSATGISEIALAIVAPVVLHDPVRQRRKLRAHAGKALRIDVADDDSRAQLVLRHDGPPGVDQQRMPVGAPSAKMLSALRGREDVALVFDGAGTQQQMPVRRA